MRTSGGLNCLRELARSMPLCAALLLLAPLAALGEPVGSLFTTEAAGSAPSAEIGREPGRGQPRRIARVDGRALGALRDAVAAGRPGRLRLNLLEDVDFTARLERSAPTASGYTLSGPLEGVPFGRAVLVVNDGVALGRIYTPGGNYAVRTAAGGLPTVERMAPEPLRCGVGAPPGADAQLDGGARPSHRPGPALGMPLFRPAGEAAAKPAGARDGPAVGLASKSGAAGSAASAPDDGDVVDVLVVYPSFVREHEGGYAPMLSLIDLDIATANEAYAASGVRLRVRLAAAEEVEYPWLREALVQTLPRTFERALQHLTERDDGHLDEVHALRDRHAADLVLLHRGGWVQESVQYSGGLGGIAWAIHDVTPDALDAWAFSVARSGDGTFVAHELGHSMGLHHDRHRGSRNRPFPYSHGFRYNIGNNVFGTVMSQYSGAQYAPFVLAFSNPDLVHPDDPDLRLGVPGDQPSEAPDGPADASRHLNELRGVLANARSSADADPCTYEVTGDREALPASGGARRVRVETQPGCAWTAAGGEWMASVSPRAGAGSADVEYRVGANDLFQRPVELMVAGQVHAVAQAGSRPVTPVCERSLSMRHILESNHPDRERLHPIFQEFTPCEELDFGPDYLASLRTFRYTAVTDDNGLDASKLRPGDFDGLTGLADLKLHSVESLRPGFLFGLTGLRVLEVGVEHSWEPETATLREVEPGAFRGLPGLRRLELGPHRLERLSPGAFEGLSGLETLVFLRPQNDALTLEPGAFGGLSELRTLNIVRHSLNSLRRGVFEGMGKLAVLGLNLNELESLAPGTFRGLPELLRLSLSVNRLVSLPVGVFDGLSNLERLDLNHNGISELPAGPFKELASLKKLSLASNAMTTIEPGAFAGLSKLEDLFLTNNRLRNLPPNLFKELKSLTSLTISGNNLGALRKGQFAGAEALRRLNMLGAGVTSIEPGTFDDVPGLHILFLRANRLRELAPGTLRGLDLQGLFLDRNPGSPFTFSPVPVALPPPDPAQGLPMEFALEADPVAPFRMAAELSASGGALSTRSPWFQSGEPRSAPVLAEPDGDGPMVVRVDRVGWRGEGADEEPESQDDGTGPLTITVDLGYGRWEGLRVVPGPPLTLYGFPDVEASLGGGPRTFDLPSAFSHFLGGAEYAASSDDGGVAAVGVDGRTLTVSPLGAGTAEVTVTATGPGGEALTRRFSVAVADDRPWVPLFLSGSHAGREGFARVLNRSGRSGEVRITAVDDEGARRGPVALRLRPYGAVNFNSGDLEEGSPGKGLAEGVGFGAGDWRLEFESDLDVEALAYARAGDGFVTGMGDVAPASGGVSRIATFNPAGSPLQLSRLRVVNRGGAAAAVTVRGVDDAGASPGGPVRFTVPAGGARTFDAVQLEAGGPPLDGALGDGEGRWRLTVASDVPVAALGLLENVPAGHLTNLSSGPVSPDGDGTHHVPLFPAASDPSGHQGLLRVVNRSDRAGTVRIRAFDEAGAEHGPLALSIGAGGAAHVNSDDLEHGAAGKGLEGSAGPGDGDWRLALDSGLDIGVLAYVRTGDGFLTSVHEVVAVRDGRRRVATFNPGSNTGQVSVLRLVNPTGRDADVSVVGTDDAGRPPPSQWVWADTEFQVPAGGALELDAAELEAGIVSDYALVLAAEGIIIPETSDFHWRIHPWGDGAGKWQLSVATEPGVLVQSLLRSPTGHLTNLSTDGR